MEARKAEKRLSIDNGKEKYSLELFPAALWPEKSAAEGLCRVRINGKWHCPNGRYSFLPGPAIADLCLALLGGNRLPAAPQKPALPLQRRGCRVRFPYGACEQGLPESLAEGWTLAPAHLAADGLWWAWCHSPETGPVLVPVEDITLRGYL